MPTIEIGTSDEIRQPARAVQSVTYARPASWGARLDLEIHGVPPNPDTIKFPLCTNVFENLALDLLKINLASEKWQ